MQQAVSIFFFKRGNSVTKSTHTAGQSNLYVILNDLNIHFQAFSQNKLKWNGISDTYLETLEKWTKFSWFFSEFKFVEKNNFEWR